MRIGFIVVTPAKNPILFYLSKTLSVLRAVNVPRARWLKSAWGIVAPPMAVEKSGQSGV
jgi:hypothetical protein